MEDKEKIPETEIKPKGKFFTWLENFWYHYKWHTIIISVAVIILSVCMWQVSTTEKHDIIMVYAGPKCLSIGETRQVEEIISGLLPSDKDKNGKKDASISMYEIYSAEQMEAETDSTGAYKVNTVRNTSQKSEYDNYMRTGGSSVCFLDPWLYEQIPEGYVYPLSKLFDEGNMPKGNIDGYGIRLGDTDLYREYGVINKAFPPDTIICLRSPYVWGTSSDDEKYQFEIDTFKAIITYTSDSTDNTESQSDGETTEESSSDNT